MNDPYQHLDPQTGMLLRMKDAERHYNSARLLIQEGAQQLEAAQKSTSGRRYSVVRAINAVINRSRLDGLELEQSQECAHRMGLGHDASRPFVPWSMLAQRALIAGTAAQGGNIVPDNVPPAVAALWPYATVVRLGAPVYGGLSGDVLIPRVSTSASAAWLAETGTGTSSDQVLAQHSAQPKKISGSTPYSKQLLMQGPQVEGMVNANLLGVLGREIDKAMLSGTGTTQPLGILNTVGITLTTGTAYDHAAAQAQVKNVASANVVDEAIRWVAPPATRELLAKRGVNGTAAEAGFIWQRNMIADKSAFVSSNVPAAQLYCGDFTQAWLLMWGAGIQLEIDSYSSFRSDVVTVKAVCFADVAVVQPAAFHVSTGIT